MGSITTAAPSGGTLTYSFSECHDQTVAVSDDELALPVDSVIGTINDLGTAPVQFLRQRVDSCYAEVGVIGAFGTASTNLGVIGTAEEHLNVVAPDDSKDGRGIGGETCALSVPVPGDLETENVPIILGCLHHVRHCELRNSGLKPSFRRGRCVQVLSFVLTSAGL